MHELHVQPTGPSAAAATATGIASTAAVSQFLASATPAERVRVRRRQAVDDGSSENVDIISSPAQTPGSVLPDLPPFTAASEPAFTWGRLEGEEFAHAIHCAYSEIVHWRRNVFSVPSGKTGKMFVRELTALFHGYAQASAKESVALEAIMVACSLLLQKPFPGSKCRDHVSALERRLKAWQDGDIDNLAREGRTIQSRLKNHHYRQSEDANGPNARRFAKLVLEGKMHAAIRFLTENADNGVLELDDTIGPEHTKTVREVLRDKHPTARDASTDALPTTSALPPQIHPVLFDSLTANAIRAAALRTHGSAGPSGIDAAGWRRLCCSFHKESVDLCAAIAAFAKRLCTTHVDPRGLEAFVACRLIPVNKNPGVRPIGVCEVIRRIVGKAILVVVGPDILQAAGPLQLCVGQEAGCEAAFHAMREVFRDAETDAVILVDATNAFNNLNRRVALINIQYLCPSVAVVLINCYRAHTLLYTGGDVLLSQEGTTQGDPLAMVMFGLATLPLIRAVTTINSTQAWYADDAGAGGKLRPIRQWWDKLLTAGPLYGYFPNALKTNLIVKEDKRAEATDIFKDTSINICTGKRYLGGALGTDDFGEQFLKDKVNGWIKEVKVLAQVAKSQPHAAYAAFVHGLIGRWVYTLRVGLPSAANLTLPLEKAVRQTFIPALTGQPELNNLVRDLLSLPARQGGLGIVNATELPAIQQTTSAAVCQPLVSLIRQQGGDIKEASGLQRSIKYRLQRERRALAKATAMELKNRLPNSLRQCVVAGEEKGASSWLSAIPLESHGFVLHKGAFRDALALRYNWPFKHLGPTCACGSHLDAGHVLICQYNGFHTLRHNHLRDMTSELLSEVCPSVVSEPPLQALSGEQLPTSCNRNDDARADIKAHGFWNRYEDAFFDIRVFYPFAPSYQTSSLPALYRKQEKQKKREYGQRIREVERGSFTPLVLTTGGGMAPEATVFYKRLASLLSEKRNESYPVVMGWLRCTVSFCLLHSALACLRGSSKSKRIQLDSITEAVTSGRLPV